MIAKYDTHADNLRGAVLKINGGEEWEIRPCTNMAVFHDLNADSDNDEPTPNFILIDSGNKCILIGGRTDTFMLGEVIARLMSDEPRSTRSRRPT